MARPSGRPIRDELIDAATRRIQQVGVNGFSYGDIAKELGIKAPSIHHHFPSKEDLVAAVAADYRTNFEAMVDAIPDGPVLDRIRDYAELFGKTAQDGRLCLCGAVSAEWLSVGEKPRTEINAFFLSQQNWLEEQLANGVRDGDIVLTLPAAAVAATLFAALQGSLLLSRAGGPNNLPTDSGDVISALLVAP